MITNSKHSGYLKIDAFGEPGVTVNGITYRRVGPNMVEVRINGTAEIVSNREAIETAAFAEMFATEMALDAQKREDADTAWYGIGL